jgi:hypothetical protein
MPSKMKTCEDYRAAMTDAAAAAVEPSLELRSHFDVCASCHAAFAEETQLFAAIDSGLRTAANSEVPASFFPRVRATLEHDAALQRSWAPPLIFAAAGVAIVLTVFMATHPGHTGSDNQAKQISSAPSNGTSETPVRREVIETPATVAASGLDHSRERRNLTRADSGSSSRMEVIVPPEEREALARFVASLKERNNDALTLAASASENKDEPMSVQPLEIAELEVTSLESVASEVPDGRKEKQ